MTRVMRGFSGVATIAAAFAATACGTAPEKQTVICSDFRVGADLTSSTFGATGKLATSYPAFAQAAGDIATVASTMFRDVGAACRSIALDLGVDPADPRLASATVGDGVDGPCTAAAEQIRAVRPRLEAVNFRLEIAPAVCTTDVTYQLACEAKCQTDAACKEAPVTDRCAPADREGSCPGKCTGTCDGAVLVEWDSMGATGVAQTLCDGHCVGGCTEPLVGEMCAGALAPPRCAGDPDCQVSCGASAVARGTCTDGEVRIDVDDDAEIDEDLALAIGSLEQNLPPILKTAAGRAEVLHDGASSLVDAAGHVLKRGDELGPQGAACGLIIGRTGEAASRNLENALDGARMVKRAVDGG